MNEIEESNEDLSYLRNSEEKEENDVKAINFKNIIKK